MFVGCQEAGGRKRALLVLKPLLHFGVHHKWELKPEIIQCPRDMQESLCEGHHLIVAVNGLKTN